MRESATWGASFAQTRSPVPMTRDRFAAQAVAKRHDNVLKTQEDRAARMNAASTKEHSECEDKKPPLMSQILDTLQLRTMRCHPGLKNYAVLILEMAKTTVDQNSTSIGAGLDGYNVERFI